MAMVKIDGHSYLVKDTKTGAVINTNKAEIEAARKRKIKRKETEAEMLDLKLQVERLTTIIEQLVEKQI